MAAFEHFRSPGLWKVNPTGFPQWCSKCGAPVDGDGRHLGGKKPSSVTYTSSDLKSGGMAASMARATPVSYRGSGRCRQCGKPASSCNCYAYKGRTPGRIVR
ncbi:MAG: hypothetical protein ACYTG0_12725 [Planctomycetota bacterium]|jgi:hypothetical protein